MPIAVLCPSCQASLKVPDQMAGKQVKCPKCSQPIAAGRGGTTPAAPQTPAAAKIKVTCPACAKVLLAPAQAAGKAIKCPGCGKPVRVPGNGAAQPPAAPAKKLAVGAEAPPQVVAAKKTPPAKTSPEAPPTPNKDRAGTAGPGAPPGRPLEEMFEEEEVPPQYQDALREELAKGEEVLWVGRPVLEIRLRKATVGVILGAVLGVVAVGLVGVGIALHQTVMIIIGGVLVPFSVLFLLARYLVQRFAGGREVYLVTNRRALLYPPLRSYDRRQLHNQMELRESSYQEGAGSLIFEVKVEFEAKPGMQRPGQNSVTERRTEYGFMDIADVAAIEKLIRNTILRTKPGKADEDLEDGADAEEQVGRVAAREVEKEPASVGTVEESRNLIEDSPVSERLKERAVNRLDDDERVLWVGQPHQKLVLVRSLGPAIFSLVAAVVLGVLALKNMKQQGWMTLIAAAVFLVIAIATPIVQRLRARGTLYVLTQRRATVWQPNVIGLMTVCDYTVEKLSKMFRRNSWVVKGAGDLVFRTLTKITTTHYYKQSRGGGGRSYAGSQSSVQTFYWGFLAIAEVAQVEDLINEHVVGPYLDRIHQ